MTGLCGLHGVADGLSRANHRGGRRWSILAQLSLLPRVVSSVAALSFAGTLHVTLGLEYWRRSADPAFAAGAHRAGFASHVTGSAFRLQPGPMGRGPFIVWVGLVMPQDSGSRIELRPQLP